jgi:hypothetical protein
MSRIVENRTDIAIYVKSATITSQKKPGIDTTINIALRNYQVKLSPFGSIIPARHGGAETS